MPVNPPSLRRPVPSTTSNGSPPPRLFYPTSANSPLGLRAEPRRRTLPGSWNDIDDVFIDPPRRTPDSTNQRAQETERPGSSKLQQLLQGTRVIDFAHSLLRMLSTSASVQALVQECQAQIGSSNQDSPSLLPTISHTPEPSDHAPRLFQSNPQSRPQGYRASFDNSPGRDVPPSYSSIQSPRPVPYPSTEYILRPAPRLDVVSLHNRLASHHSDLSLAGDPTQSRDPTLPQAGAKTTGRTQIVPSSGSSSGSVPSPIVCSARTTKNVFCTIRPAAATARLLPAGEKWFCHHHVDSASGSSQVHRIVCSGKPKRKPSCNNKPSAATLQKLLRDGVEVWFCHRHRPAASKSSEQIHSTVPRVWCAGKRGRNKPCENSGVAPLDWPSQLDGEEMPYFCAEHEGEMLASSGFYSTRTGERIEYDDWIVDDPNLGIKPLSDKTKALLRGLMKKGPSPSDDDGFIYCYKLLQDDDPNYVHLKVGRSNNFVRRVSNWRKQCGTDNVLMGWFPGLPDGVGLSEVALKKTLVERGLAQKGKYCSLLERLIHLNLKDIAVDYELGPCACGTSHREIFTFDVKGMSEENAWEYLVKPIIERWYRFVNEHT